MWASGRSSDHLGGSPQAGSSSRRRNEVQELSEQVFIPLMPFLKGSRFDILAYSLNYLCGRDKTLRLLSIAKHCGEEGQELVALEIAYKEAKMGVDVNVFRKVATIINGRLGPDFGLDQKWCNTVEENWNRSKDGIKERVKKCEEDYEYERRFRYVNPDGTRREYNEGGQLFYMHGDLNTAMHMFLDSMRFCWSREAYHEEILPSLVTLIGMGCLRTAFLIAREALRHRQLFDPIITFPILRATIALASLKEEDFTYAAHQFLRIGSYWDIQFCLVMAPHDIATYGVLCALATFERTELKALVMDNQSFKRYLDSAVEVKDLIHDFYSCRYSSAFEHLANLRKWLMGDIYLFNKFETLHELIRKKAMVQYIQPYAAVDLRTMAETFNTNIEALTKDLVALINTKQIKGKIDSIDKVLYARRDERATLRSVLQSCSVIERTFRSVLLFESVLQQAPSILLDIQHLIILLEGALDSIGMN